MEVTKIGLFGGTFNPIHSGHLRAGEITKEKFSLERIIYIPSYIPPHKESGDIAAPFHRLKMVELACAPYPRFLSSSIEIDAEGTSYSILTLSKLARQFPRSSIFFILGVDAFLEIESWKDYERLLERFFFIVISRPGYSLEEAKKVGEGKYRRKVYEIEKSGKVKDTLFSSYSIYLLPIRALDIASTEIREKVKKEESIKGLVPDQVEVYIRENKLYQG
jgi:nicotinate-nucleotide adenylyltransferase